VRRGGVPHEATIGLPVLLTLFVTAQSEKAVITLSEATGIFVVGTVVSGAWLGFAWNGTRLCPLVLRPLVMAAFIVACYAVGKHPPLGEGETYGHMFATLSQALYGLFFFGWVTGNTLREVVITLYISNERRLAFESRIAKIKYASELIRHPLVRFGYWTRLSVGKEEKRAATTFDLLMARFIGETLTPKGLAIVIAGVLAVVGILRSL
jgi:hypothetical protein